MGAWGALRTYKRGGVRLLSYQMLTLILLLILFLPTASAWWIVVGRRQLSTMSTWRYRFSIAGIAALSGTSLLWAAFEVYEITIGFGVNFGRVYQFAVPGLVLSVVAGVCGLAGRSMLRYVVLFGGVLHSAAWFLAIQSL